MIKQRKPGSVTAKLMLSMSILLTAWAHAQGPQQLAGNYSLTLNVSSVKGQPKKIYFWYKELVKGGWVLHQDSSVVENNQVQFYGTLNEPHQAFFCTKPMGSKSRVNEGDRMDFYLSPGVIKIITVDSLNAYRRSGGNFDKEYQDFKKLKSLYDHKVISLAIKSMHLDKHKDSVTYYRNEKLFNDTVSFYANTICRNWVIQHPSSPVALLPLNWYAGSVIKDPNATMAVYNLLNPQIKSLPSAVYLKNRIDQVRKTEIGSPAPLFTMVDTAGKPISLTSYRGKYVLLDFWASWCAPCRRENPNVVANFERFKDQNFEVIGVSLDSESGKSAWLKAIHTDHLEKWSNISDLKGFNNEVAQRYSVQAVPQNFLIDPSGKIIGKNVTGKMLTRKLEEVLMKKNNKALQSN